MTGIAKKETQEISSINKMTNLMGVSKVRDMFDNALKENSGAFISSLIDLYNSDTYLQKCSAQDVMMEALKAATLNLQINKSLGFAYIVPFGTKPTLVIGYKGLIQLAMRTGQYKHINSGNIYEGMELEEDYLSGTFSIKGKKKSEKVIGYFAYFKLINGFEKALYMSKDEVEVYGKKYSKSYTSGPWSSEFDGMARKTVIRQLLGTYGILSTELQNVIKDDADREIEQDILENANQGVMTLGDEPEYVEIEGEIIDVETGEVVTEEKVEDVKKTKGKEKEPSAEELGFSLDDIKNDVPF